MTDAPRDYAAYIQFEPGEDWVWFGSSPLRFDTEGRALSARRQARAEKWPAARVGIREGAPYTASETLPSDTDVLLELD